ncbi:hypothetical protein EUGRSUZ_K03231 [Eucalyptus grandis]|uniref:Uncharacterized protein n=2 Tax=Eucalyptus grandis TaxID=71139 RepID=A0ACC3IZX2_EUCGR|nr:hypothetical protein EUGRSUZ_K03231 [Eucalyptus grandis]
MEIANPPTRNWTTTLPIGANSILPTHCRIVTVIKIEKIGHFFPLIYPTIQSQMPIRDCQTVALFLSNNTRFPKSVKFRPTTDFAEVFVDQATVPSASFNTKSPSGVSSNVAPIFMGLFRLADHTTRGSYGILL